MKEALSINTIDQEHLSLSGRLDSFGAQTLDQELDERLRKGNYTVFLNLEKVQYLSSAGIRILLKYHKQHKSLNGELGIDALSDNAREIFELAGIENLLLERIITGNAKEGVKRFSSDKAVFAMEPLGNGTLVLNLHGKPFVKGSTYRAEDSRVEVFNTNKYAFGLGALGEDFERCRSQFGEYLAVGDAAFYMPTDDSKSADYVYRIKNMVPKVVSLNSIILQGEFDSFSQFSTKDATNTIGLSEIIDTCFKQSETSVMGFVLLAETKGIVGCSLNVSPANESELHNAFSFPAIREKMNITTEPEYNGCLSLICGIVHNGMNELEAFSRPLEGTDLFAHAHASIFSFQPLQKNNTDLSNAVKKLVEGSKLHSVLHLLNDNRPHEGIGESNFSNGSIWFGAIHETIKA